MSLPGHVLDFELLVEGPDETLKLRLAASISSQATTAVVREVSLVVLVIPCVVKEDLGTKQLDHE